MKTIPCIHEVDSEGSCWFAQNLLSSNMQEGTKEDRNGGGREREREAQYLRIYVYIYGAHIYIYIQISTYRYLCTTKLLDGLVVPPVVCFCPSHLQKGSLAPPVSLSSAGHAWIKSAQMKMPKVTWTNYQSRSRLVLPPVPSKIQV